MSKAPIWQMYGVEDLSQKTGYRLSYLRRWKKEGKLPPEGFRRRVAAALNRSESDLFGTPQEVKAQ